MTGRNDSVRERRPLRVLGRFTLGLVATFAACAIPVAAAGGFWLPEDASTVAADVDRAWNAVLWLSIVFFVLIVVAMVWFVVRYRGSRGAGTKPSLDHSTPLEVTWTVIPTLLVAGLFWIGFDGYINLAVPPEGGYEIEVEGQKWNWLFYYPNGYADENLHVPADTDVVLTMTSKDVLHSFFVPAFRTKKDVVPGRYTKLWFNAPEPGEYQVFCTEYCGQQHWNMLSKVVVHPKDEFDAWLADASDLHGKFSPVEIGEIYYNRFGCQQCHSLDGSAGSGPTFLGLWGSERALSDGSTVLADENYIRESILYPQAKLAQGYDPVMPTFQGRFDDRDVAAIIAYIKSLEGS